MVKRVAIIGGGPSGIATLYELTRVLKDGRSLFGKQDVSSFGDEEFAFLKVSLFERNASVGGAWSDSVVGKFTDPQLPNFEETPENFDKPEVIFRKGEIPDGIEQATYKKPIIVEETKSTLGYKYQWKGTGVYEGLFTNVPAKYMSFSFDRFDYKSVETEYPLLEVLQPATDVGAYLKGVAERNNLYKHIRLNTTVENVKKIDDVWHIILREEVKLSEDLVLHRWYKEEYDFVVVGNGKTIPLIPTFKNFTEFVKKNNDLPKDQRALISHTKSLGHPSVLRNSKKILVIGSNVSAADLVQYAYPRHYDKPNIYISRKESITGRWTDFALFSYGIESKPEVEEFLPETNSVKFKDGTVESNFDVILLATGYHMHYPFIDELFFKSHERVTDFYLYTFSLADPTLALVGNTYAAFFFNRVESQGAALAGIWGGFAELPPVEEQSASVDHPIQNQLNPFNIKEVFIDKLLKYAVSSRPNPFDLHERYQHVRDISQSKGVVERLFFDLKEGKYSPEQIVTRVS